MSNNGTTGTGRIGLIALGVASIGLVAAIAYSALRHEPRAVEARPAAAADALDPNSVNALTERIKTHPDDAGAWQALGEAHFRAQRFDEAVTALEKSAALEPGNAVHWSALGEARVMASAHDPMPPAALEAFQKAAKINPKDPRTRYFLAVARDLKGDHKGAIDDWIALLKDTPSGAPWEADLRRTIEQVGKINEIDVAKRLAAIPTSQPHMPLPGPDADQVRAAAAMPPSQQDAMARGMVESLENKLKANPGNIDGWVMLMRSRMTLGEPGKARTALVAAVNANPAARVQLESEASSMGVPPR